MYLIVVLILGEELEVEREVLGDLPILEVLRNQVLVDGDPSKIGRASCRERV